MLVVTLGAVIADDAIRLRFYTDPRWDTNPQRCSAPEVPFGLTPRRAARI